MRENVPNYLVFDVKAKDTFSILVHNYNYKLIEVVTKEYYVRHTYKNLWRFRKVIIENQTFPVDYGFSFSIVNLLTKNSTIIYNTPWVKQDLDCNFLQLVKNKVFNNHELNQILKGLKWKNFRTILFQE